MQRHLVSKEACLSQRREISQKSPIKKTIFCKKSPRYLKRDMSVSKERDISQETSLLRHAHQEIRRILQHTATHCNILQHTTTHCDTLHQKRYVERDTQQPYLLSEDNGQSQKSRVYCNTLQHTATHCNTLQQPYLLSKEHCSQSQKNRILQHTATHHNTLQHTPTHCIKRAMGLLTKDPCSQSQKTRILVNFRYWGRKPAPKTLLGWRAFSRTGWLQLVGSLKS